MNRVLQRKRWPVLLDLIYIYELTGVKIMSQFASSQNVVGMSELCRFSINSVAGGDAEGIPRQLSSPLALILFGVILSTRSVM